MKILALLLAALSLSVSASPTYQTPFFFGLASAPGHAEDELDDIWLDWAKKDKTRAWSNQTMPEKRLEFWTKPEIELDLAQKTGIEVYRMGVDWGRVMPKADSFDIKAIARYHEILKMVKQRNMKVMLTLFHHSVPKWIQEQGGWQNPETNKHFLKFSQRMIEEFQNDVSYWITINEANIFSTLAYTAGMWPPGEERGATSLLTVGPFRGDTVKAMDHMAYAHNEVYIWAHKKYPTIKMGIAQNMAYYTGKSFIDRFLASFTDGLMNWRFPNLIKDHMDFFGFNYYGAEWIKGTTVDIDPEEEYSEAGRSINPVGLYKTLKEIHERFPSLPIIITENGISDDTDILRGSYLIEHLLAISKAREEGVPVEGYIFWTLSDNMEWADGYCPKFGLVAVDRKNNFNRVPRESFNLFQKIATTKVITTEMRDLAWKKVQSNIGVERPLCRAQDGKTALDVPRLRKINAKDWRFYSSSVSE